MGQAAGVVGEVEPGAWMPLSPIPAGLTWGDEVTILPVALSMVTGSSSRIGVHDTETA